MDTVCSSFSTDLEQYLTDAIWRITNHEVADIEYRILAYRILRFTACCCSSVLINYFIIRPIFKQTEEPN